MYTFIRNTTELGIPFATFTATGRSLWEMVWYYQNGYIKKEFINAIGDCLEIRVINEDEYLLLRNVKYHLVFAKCNTVGYMKIKLPFPEGSFVANWFRLDFKESDINPNTWLDLFGNNKLPPKFVEEEVYPIEDEYEPTEDKEEPIEDEEEPTEDDYNTDDITLDSVLYEEEPHPSIRRQRNYTED